MPTTIKIKTWGCSACGYKQDFNPNGNLWKTIFPNIPKGQCPNPACGLERLTPVTDSTKQIKVNIPTNAEIDGYDNDHLQGRTKAAYKTKVAADRTKFNLPQWRA